MFHDSHGLTDDPTKPKPVSAEGISVSGKKYEEEFEFEKQRIKAGYDFVSTLFFV
jgi:hypothetical protein